MLWVYFFFYEHTGIENVHKIASQGALKGGQLGTFCPPRMPPAKVNVGIGLAAVLCLLCILLCVARPAPERRVQHRVALGVAAQHTPFLSVCLFLCICHVHAFYWLRLFVDASCMISMQLFFAL